MAVPGYFELRFSLTSNISIAKDFITGGMAVPGYFEFRFNRQDIVSLGFHYRWHGRTRLFLILIYFFRINTFPPERKYFLIQ